MFRAERAGVVRQSNSGASTASTTFICSLVDRTRLRLLKDGYRNPDALLCDLFGYVSGCFFLVFL